MLTWRKILLVLLLLPVFAAGCQGQTSPATSGESPLPTAPPGPAGEADVVTITFACNGRQTEFGELADDFHARNPGIRVQVLEIEDLVDVRAGLSARDEMHRIVSNVDTALWMFHQREITRADLLRDLSPFIEADATFEPDDYFRGPIEAYCWDGGTWALPSHADPLLIFYNVEAFDRSGVPRPRPGWTPDEFLAAAQQLTVREGDAAARYGFMDLGSTAGADFIYDSVDDRLVDAAGTPMLDSPAVAGAVQWAVDLTLVHQVVPGPEIVGDDYLVRRQLVEDGRIAMWVDFPANLDGKRQSLDVGVAPFPHFDERSNPLLLHAGYLMSAGTVHPQESWRWLSFLSRQEIGEFGGGVMPARRSLAEQSGYWEGLDEETADAIRYAAEHGRTMVWDEVVEELFLAWLRVLDGEPVEEALAEAQAAALERVAQAAQTTPIPVVVATPRPAIGDAGSVVTFASSSGDSGSFRPPAFAFNAERYPEIEVRILGPYDDSPVDCFSGEGDVTFDPARRGILNLQSLVDADPAFSPDDFDPRFLDAFRHQGDLWGVPTSAQVRLVFYNRDLFDTAGEPYPEAGWTLDDFQAHAQALTVGGGEDKVYGFLPLHGHRGGLRAFMALQGVQLWDEEWRPRFDAPDVAAAVRWYADLALVHGVMPALEDMMGSGVAWERRAAMVRAGRAAMWTDYAGADRASAWPVRAEVGMAPLPLREAGASGVTDFVYRGLFISEDAADPRACWEWITHLSAQQELVRGLPARVSVLESPGFEARVGEDAVTTYRATLVYANLWDVHPMTSEAAEQEEALNQALADILAGADPETALAEAQRQAEECEGRSERNRSWQRKAQTTAED